MHKVLDPRTPETAQLGRGRQGPSLAFHSGLWDKAGGPGGEHRAGEYLVPDEVKADRGAWGAWLPHPLAGEDGSWVSCVGWDSQGPGLWDWGNASSCRESRRPLFCRIPARAGAAFTHKSAQAEGAHSLPKVPSRGGGKRGLRVGWVELRRKPQPHHGYHHPSRPVPSMCKASLSGRRSCPQLRVTVREADPSPHPQLTLLLL